ncbi:MAG: magnesium/cobalt transporter CorA [Acidimicrobiia bacterium]
MQALRYVKGNPGSEPVDIDNLGDAIDPEHAVVWIDTDDPSDEERERVTQQLRLAPLVVDAFMNPKPERTKLIRYGEYFHVAVHDCDLRGDEFESREIDVVMGPGWIVTVRRPASATDGTPFERDEVERRFELQRSEHNSTEEGFLLWALFDVLIDRYFDVSDRIDDSLDDIEEDVFRDERVTGIPQGIFVLRRALVEFRRASAPMREVLDAITRKDVPFVCEESISHFRELHDRVLRVLDFVETQRDLLTGLLEANLSLISNRLNTVMKKVTSWGAILIVATLIAGIYGMNFRHMPELKWEFGYPLALGSMVVAMGALYLVFKKKDWL